MHNDSGRFRSLCSYKILMTTDTVGGVWSYSIDLASQLTQRGAEVLLATFGPLPSEEQRAAARSVKNLHLIEGQFPLEWMPEATCQQLRRSGEWLLSHSRAFQPDVVHLNGYFHGVLPWQAPTIVVAHSCVYSWWRSTHGALPPSSWLAYHQRVSRGIAAANAIVAPSEFMLRAIHQIYSLSSQVQRVIHNFSNFPQTSGTKEDAIFASGRYWDPAKNVLLLNRISKSLPWPIYLAGRTDGPNGEHQACDRLLSLGELSRVQMADVLSRMSIFVHPAKYEPFGLSVLEAAMNSCALVLSDISGLRELWGECALYADADDQEQWIEHIRRLTSDPALRLELGRRAARRAKTFSPARAVAGYISLYHSLVHGESASVGALVPASVRTAL